MFFILYLLYVCDKQTPGLYQSAIDNLWKVVIGTWSSDFDEIEVTALFELNQIIHSVGYVGGIVSFLYFSCKLQFNCLIVFFIPFLL